MTEQPKPGVAIVIGSGGVKCAAVLGLLRALNQADIPVNLLVGCSGGSLYATGLALGYSPERMREMTLSFWTPALMENYTANLRAATEGTLSFNERSGLVDDRYLWQVMEGSFGEYTFDDVQIPLRVVSTDFLTGESVVHSDGRLAQAARASVSVPVVFPPYELDGKLLVDGAVADPLPVDVAIKEGAQVIIAMGFELDVRPRLRTLTAVNNHMNTIFMNNILRSQFAFHNLAHHAEIVLILPEFDRRIGTFDTHHLEYIIQAGEEVAQREMPYIKRLVNAQ